MDGSKDNQKEGEDPDEELSNKQVKGRFVIQEINEDYILLNDSGCSFSKNYKSLKQSKYNFLHREIDDDDYDNESIPTADEFILDHNSNAYINLNLIYNEISKKLEKIEVKLNKNMERNELNLNMTGIENKMRKNNEFAKNKKRYKSLEINFDDNVLISPLCSPIHGIPLTLNKNGFASSNTKIKSIKENNKLKLFDDYDMNTNNEYQLSSLNKRYNMPNNQTLFSQKFIQESYLPITNYINIEQNNKVENSFFTIEKKRQHKALSIDNTISIFIQKNPNLMYTNLINYPICDKCSSINTINNI
jgi:hypothetical protein